MRALFDGIPLQHMNTSMTINAPAMWLLALYLTAAEEQGADIAQLAGTTQNDIIKEYLSRGTYVFPPVPSLRLITDMITYTVHHVPRWNPINVCSYHLQEAGATPVQEVAFALGTAIAVLDAVRASGQVDERDFGAVVGRISFFVNAGVRFVEEMCKLRAFGELWGEITRDRYGVTDPNQRRFRYGVQVNSLGLTETQPENNVTRILLEMLAVTLSRDARARAVQLPTWNEALGLPRPWDQQWSLRLQQIAALETDILEYEDIFDGSHVIEATTDRLAAQIRSEIARIAELGGAGGPAALAYMKERLVLSNAARIEAIESCTEARVGVNTFTETETSPLTAGEQQFLTVNETAERDQIASLRRWRGKRDADRAHGAIAALEKAARGEENIMPASIACARAGVTTGEWAETLRRVFGEYRAPTGVASQAPLRNEERIVALRAHVEEASRRLGRRLSLLIAKPGLDGHSSGAEQIAIRARDAGMDVTYDGIRFTPKEVVAAVIARKPDVLGLSVLSGSHVPLVCDIAEHVSAAGMTGLKIVAGGIIPEEDAVRLKRAGIAAVFTPKDYDLDRIMRQIVDLALMED
jgi:(2R)-ethylmalonyl-CoA mutase